MLTRFLLIGVGGSGGKTLRYCWRELDRKLEAAGWTEGLPQAWQFLHIDVPEIPDGIEGDVPADVGMEYLGLARQPRRYADFDRDLVTSDSAILPVLAEWRPDPALTYAPPYNGAGQRRAVGRVVTITEIDRIGDKLNAAVLAMSSPDAEAQLGRLSGKLGQGSSDNRPPMAVVVSSLAGGSGSGAFLDIVELLISRAGTQGAQWLRNNLITVLYAADVFSDLNPRMRQGTEPNSLAAIAELLNACEHEGPVPPLEVKLLAAGGATGKVSGSRIGSTNFIIGSRNRHMSFPNSLDVFRSVGKAFAALMTDDDVQELFTAYVGTTDMTEKVKPSFGVVDLDADHLPCTSLGYSNVSLGRSLFGRYASERLVKRSVERLLRGHKEDQPPGDQVKTDDALIAERVEQVHKDFFDAAGLHEETSEHNQILDRLRDPEQAGVIKRFGESVSGRFRNDTAELPPGEWRDFFMKFFDEQAQTLLQEQRDARTQRSVEWVRATQENLLAATAAQVGAHGLPVAIELLEALDAQLRRAAKELEKDAAKFDIDQQKLIGGADALFRVKEKLFSPRHPNFPKAYGQRRDALVLRVEEELHGFASKLILSLVEELLPPLKQSLRNALTAFTRAEEECQAQIQQWSSEAMPTHLRAAPNEVLLEPQDEYPEQYAQLLERTFEMAPRNAEGEAIREVISGAWTAHAGEAIKQSLIKQDSNWVTSVREARGPGDASTTPSFALAPHPHSLEHNANRWVFNRHGIFSEYVTASLSEWLSPQHTDKAARASAFGHAMGQALRMSQPLVSINPSVYMEVHGSDLPDPTLIIGKIPLATGHPARPAVEAALEEAGKSPGDIDRLFDPNAAGDEVPISSFVGSRVHPIVFDSLTAPIQSDWQSRTDDAGRSQFWRFRRSRTLTSFVPLSPARQRSLIRGWLTADLLGQVTKLGSKWSEAPLKIWSPKGWRQFPEHLLGADVTDRGKILPGLMESLPLAMVAFGTGNHEQLAAYLRLLELGSPGGGAADEYTEANAEIAQWVLDGALPAPEPAQEAAPAPPQAKAGGADGTAQERASTMAESLRKTEAAYRSSIGDLQVTVETTLSLGPAWEIWELFCAQALSLASVIELLPDSGGDDDEDMGPVPQSAGR
jgi:hypothetical protein